MKYLFTLFLSLFLFNSTAFAAGYNVADAYKELRHNQTTFDKGVAAMDAAESKYLDHLFFVTDVAFRERMLMLRYARSGQAGEYIERYNKEIGNVLGSFEFIRPKTRVLQNVEATVIQAIREQQKFFNIWHKASAITAENLQKNYARHYNPLFLFSIGGMVLSKLRF